MQARESQGALATSYASESQDIALDIVSLEICLDVGTEKKNR